MTVVTNSGPLIVLGKLGLLHVLAKLHERVIMPSCVHDEVVSVGLRAGHSDARTTELATSEGAITVIPVAEVDLPADIRGLALGQGERHAMHLARVESAEWVLLDDLLARQHASRLGLAVKGSIGVIAGACRGGLITPDHRDSIFESLASRSDIWLSESLVHRVWSQLKREM